MTEYNCGIDLQMYICVMDREGNKLVHKNIKGNDVGFFLKLVEPYRHDLTIVRECFEWKTCRLVRKVCISIKSDRPYWPPPIATVSHDLINCLSGRRGAFGRFLF